MSQYKLSTVSGLADVQAFLAVNTPSAWLTQALTSLDIILIDHAHCEKKAASTALSLLYRYPQHSELLQQMSRLAREELRHFEQVLAIMQRRGIRFQHLSPSRYAAGMLTHVRTVEPQRLIDTLILGAFIEARSCERFAALVPLLEPCEPELAAFYFSLLKSEARHYQHYLAFAETFAGEAGLTNDVPARVQHFRAVEAELIESADDVFRFHSGVVLSSEGLGKVLQT